MAYTFDSLGYAKRLRDRGVAQDQAEAHAEAARDFIMPELATKADLLATEQRLRTELRTSISELQTELRTSVTELRTSNETLALRLTVRLGAMLVVGFGALATMLTILKLS
jgi:hypothetical protein